MVKNKRIQLDIRDTAKARTFMRAFDCFLDPHLYLLSTRGVNLYWKFWADEDHLVIVLEPTKETRDFVSRLIWMRSALMPQVKIDVTDIEE